MKYILATSSPRRIELFRQSGLEFKIKSKQVDETLDENLTIPLAVEKNALKKAQAVNDFESMVIGADTVVVVDNQVLGKPISLADAKSMLERLSNRTHAVITAVAVLYQEEYIVFHDIAKVTFMKLSDEWIDEYVTHYDVLDKAGAYGLQDNHETNHFIEQVEGDPTTVVGLPMIKLEEVLIELRRSMTND